MSSSCQFHLEHDNMEYHLHMEIWKGNINKALNNAKERDELSDWLVAMAPLASHATWLSVCEDYAHQLESDGQYHKAATYLMACHRNYDAIDLFKRHRLYKEAVAFAKVRLSPFDPVFEDLYNSWAQQLAKEGNYEQAAKCFLAIKQVKDASRCLSKRNDPICLRTAAHISLIASEKQNGFLLAHKVICQYLQKMQYQEIYNFTQEHHNLKVFTLVTSLHELMMSVLASLMPNAAYVKDNPGFVIPEIKTASSDNGKTQLPDFILDSCDMDPLCPWKPFLINNHTFLNYVLRMWHSCMNVDLSSNSNIEEMYSTLNTLISNRQNMLKTDQLMIQNCIDLTLCLLALLQAETTSAIKHLLQMMSSLHDVGQFELLQVISQLCLPQGPKYFLKLQQEVTAIRKPQNELAKTTPVDLEVSNSNHSVKYVNSSSGEKVNMIEEGSVSLQQDAVRLQAPDLIPTGHESSPSPSNPSPNEETTISSPQLVKELLSKQSSFPSSNVSSLLPSSHCSSPCCQDEESYRSATKPRKILWKDDPPLRSQVCPLHKKYINVPDSWYDLPVDKKYGQQCINMGILLDEQDLVMSELKQGPENPTQILFPHPLSTAQLLLNVIQKSEDFDHLEKLQLLEDILSWAMEYSCTSEQQHIFQSLKEQINI
ncbi:GEMIN5 [Acanthosepion pharaonis]|uniref:GEMIN5 n=1 Tax=Acanthosepion pharaonis TaxID=158019 RepID=A0A812CGK5_ACAPH|nr:GEMIN5 [Sepia pharaonis]